MRRHCFRTIVSILAIAVGTGSIAILPIRAQSAPASVLRLSTLSADEVREWDLAVNQLSREGELRMRQQREDTLIAGRMHERFDQYYKGVRVFGGDVVRQVENTMTLSLFGTLYQGIDLDVTPALSAEDARLAIEQIAGASLGADRMPELMVLSKDEGGYALTYRGRALGDEGLMVYFLDARTGEVVFKYNDLKTDAAVGRGTGVLNDTKKISVSSSGSTFTAVDELRPGSIRTFDMRGNTNRTINFLNGITSLGAADLATDTDNVWGDGATVDAHVYAGWTYDYYFRRYGRRGLDGNNIPILSLVHPVNRQDVFRQPGSIVGLFYMNAAYFGNGVMVYGEGLPPGVTDTAGRSWDYMAGGLDVVAHELSHGVTDYSSQLIYLHESGALNETFSDVMGTAAEFFFQTEGNAPLRADYVIGEDVVAPGGIRNMADPLLLGDPDHFSTRYLGPEDNGGVHINAGIGNQVFYLAIEGGVNRTSRQGVAGVGSANREQIERVFYRAFTQLMPSNATFSVARATTIQAARDLYGSGSAAERAITQAWTAVGVH
jgi:thermolysin